MFLCLVLSLLVVGSQLLPAPELNRTKAYREAESLRQGVSWTKSRDLDTSLASPVISGNTEQVMKVSSWFLVWKEERVSLSAHCYREAKSLRQQVSQRERFSLRPPVRGDEAQSSFPRTKA